MKIILKEAEILSILQEKINFKLGGCYHVSSGGVLKKSEEGEEIVYIVETYEKTEEEE